MTVRSLDHVNIRTGDVQATVKFFHDILEMKATIPPGAETIEQAAWILDDQGNPVVHIGPHNANYPSDHVMPFVPASGSGSVHHVAFNCTGYHDVIARLKSNNLQFSENNIETIGLRQVFVIESNGIMLELNFR